MSENPPQPAGQPSDKRDVDMTPGNEQGGSSALPTSGQYSAPSTQPTPPYTHSSAPEPAAGFDAQPDYGQQPYAADQGYGQHGAQQAYDQGAGQQGWDPSYGQQPSYGQDPNYASAGYPPAGGYDPNQPYAQPGYPQQQYAGQPVATGTMSPSDERLWATLTHISIPFFGVIGPLIAYLVFKDKSAWLRESVTEALNFSILVTIGYIVSAILVAVIIGGILWAVIGVGSLVLCIMAAIASNKGEQYKYPVNWRLIK